MSRWAHRGRTLLAGFLVVDLSASDTVMDQRQLGLLGPDAKASTRHRQRDAKMAGAEFWLTISGEFVGRLWQQWEGRLAIQPLAVGDPAVFGRNFERFLRGVMNDGRGTPGSSIRQPLTWAAAGFAQLGGFVEDNLQESAPPGSDNIAERARRYIWNHSHRSLGVPHIAAATGVTRRTMERHFALAVGRSVRQEVETAVANGGTCCSGPVPELRKRP